MVKTGLNLTSGEYTAHMTEMFAIILSFPFGKRENVIYHPTITRLIKRVFGGTSKWATIYKHQEPCDSHHTDVYTADICQVEVEARFELINGMQIREHDRNYYSHNPIYLDYETTHAVVSKPTPSEVAQKALTRSMTKTIKLENSQVEKNWSDKLYYLDKRLPEVSWEIATNSRAIVDDPRWEQKIDTFRSYVDTCEPENTCLTKDQYTPSGFEIFQDKKKVIEFEWNAKSAIALIWGLIGRQLSCGTAPETNVLKHFDSFTDIMIKNIMNRINGRPVKLISI